MASKPKFDLKLDQRPRNVSNVNFDEAEKKLFVLSTPRDVRRGSEHDIKKPESFDQLDKTDLRKELELALRNLEETENELKLAAEIGVSLIEKGKEDEQKIKEAEQKIKSLKEQINMLTQSDTKFYASETDRQNEETEKRKKFDDLTSENKSLIQRNEVCRSQLEEAANINESLQQLLEEKERKLDRLQIEHSTLITANLQNKKLVNEVEKYKSSYEKVDQFELENNKLKKERDEQKSKLEELEQKLKISEKQKERLDGMLKNITLQGNEALQNENKKLREENDHLQVETFQKQKYEELTKNLMKSNEEIKNSKRDVQERLAEASNTVNKLLIEIEEYKAEAMKTDTKPAGDSKLNKGSVLDEVANQIAFDLNKPQQMEEKEKVRKEDEKILENLQVTEDYFYLCIKAIETSILVDLSEHGIKMPRRALGMKSLYDKAISDNIPFHEWHSWIRAQFTRDMIAEPYRGNTPSGYFAAKFQRLRRAIVKDNKEHVDSKDT